MNDAVDVVHLILGSYFNADDSSLDAIADGEEELDAAVCDAMFDADCSIDFASVRTDEVTIDTIDDTFTAGAVDADFNATKPAAPDDEPGDAAVVDVASAGDETTFVQLDVKTVIDDNGDDDDDATATIAAQIATGAVANVIAADAVVSASVVVASIAAT